MNNNKDTKIKRSDWEKIKQIVTELEDPNFYSAMDDIFHAKSDLYNNYKNNEILKQELYNRAGRKQFYRNHVLPEEINLLIKEMVLDMIFAEGKRVKDFKKEIIQDKTKHGVVVFEKKIGEFNK